MANCMNALPSRPSRLPVPLSKKSVTPRTKSTRRRPLTSFVKDYEAKWPKATEKIVKDREELLAFFDFPAEHWVHLKTTNPIESTFATVRLRTKVTKGPV